MQSPALCLVAQTRPSGRYFNAPRDGHSSGDRLVGRVAVGLRYGPEGIGLRISAAEATAAAGLASAMPSAFGRPPRRNCASPAQAAPRSGVSALVGRRSDRRRSDCRRGWRPAVHARHRPHPVARSWRRRSAQWRGGRRNVSSARANTRPEAHIKATPWRLYRALEKDKPASGVVQEIRMTGPKSGLALFLLLTGCATAPAPTQAPASSRTTTAYRSSGGPTN